MTIQSMRMRASLINCAIFILLIGGFGGAMYTSKYLTEEMHMKVLLGQEKMNLIPLFFSIICILLSIILVFSSFMKVRKYNKNNPSQKMPYLTLFKLGELNDEDELFIKASNEATRKVYIYYSNVMPIFCVLLLFQFSTFFYMASVLVIMAIHNLIYFNHMRKYYS